MSNFWGSLHNGDTLPIINLYCTDYQLSNKNQRARYPSSQQTLPTWQTLSQVVWKKSHHDRGVVNSGILLF